MIMMILMFDTLHYLNRLITIYGECNFLFEKICGTSWTVYSVLKIVSQQKNALWQILLTS